MNGDQGLNLLYMVLLMVLVGSALVSRRLPMGQTMKMAAAWIGIFALAFIAFSFRSEFTSIGSRLKAEAIGTPIDTGEELRIPMAEDGHFWVEASINGRTEPFLVDSGASFTTISRDTAVKAGIETGLRVAMVETANGAVEMHRATAASFAVGSIERRDFSIHVNDHGEGNVLGMNFLSSLQGWRVEGNYLVMRS